MNKDTQAGARSSSRVDFAGRRGLVNGNGLTNGNGFTNGSGLTNGIGTRKGRTNGLVNGLGRVNGTGLTNGFTNGMMKGTGLVNGRGLVNGTKLRLRGNLFGVVSHRDLRIGASLVILFVLLLPSFYLLMSTPTYVAPIQIDGSFNDWSSVPIYIDQTSSPNVNVKFTHYALTSDNNQVYVMIRVAGQVLQESQAYDGFFAFIDTDGNPSTGYWPGELGAEFAANIIGGSDEIRRAELTSFEYGGDALNWSAWQDSATIPVAFSGNSLEFAMPTNMMDLQDKWTMRLVGNDFQGNIVMSSVKIGKEFGALGVQEIPRADYSPLTTSSPSLLSVKLHAYGKTANLDSLAGRLTWQSYPSSLASNLVVPSTIVVQADAETTFSADVSVNALADGTALWLNLTGLRAEVPVTIGGNGGVGYIGHIPTEKRVDGWFGDWQTGIQTDTSPSIADPNVDVRSYASNVSRIGMSDKAFLFVDFQGIAMGGTNTPVSAKWSPGGGQAAPPVPPGPQKRVAGEDFLRFYIDANSSDQTGCPFADMTANYMIEIRGHQRHIDSRRLYSCSGGDWDLISSATVLAMNSGSKIETSIDLSLLGPFDKPDVAIETTDWNQVGDIPSPISLGTRSGSRSERTRSSDGPHVLAFPPGYDEVTSRPLSLAPNLDGRCDDSAYISAGHETNASFEFYVGHKDGYVWFCVIYYDQTNDNGDYSEITLDTAFNAGAHPQTDDRRYRLNAGGNTLQSRERGDGLSWVPCDPGSCTDGDDGKASRFNNKQNYEYEIVQANVWVTGGYRAGFAVHMHNATIPSTDAYWGSWSVDVLVPDTWGNLYIPEFPPIIMPFIVVTIAVCLGRRRRRA